MKKTLLFLGMVVFSACVSAQTTIFLETFGTTKTTRGNCSTVVSGTAEVGKYNPLKDEQYTDHDWHPNSHVWNNGIAYSQTSVATVAGTCDNAGTSLNIRADYPSSITGSSGNGNLSFTASTANSFTISGINTQNYKKVMLSFAILGLNTADAIQLKLQYDNGSGLTDVGQNPIGSLNTDKMTWLQVNDIPLPTGSIFRLKFSTPITNPLNTNNPVEIRIDDIKIIGTAITTSDDDIFLNNNQKVVVSNPTITLEGFTRGDIEIYTFQGKRVFLSEFRETIQPQLSKGLYIIRIGNFRQKISW